MKAVVGPAYSGPQSPTAPNGVLEGANNIKDLEGQIKMVASRRDLTTQQKKDWIAKIVAGIQRNAGKMEERGNVMKAYKQESK